MESSTRNARKTSSDSEPTTTIREMRWPVEMAPGDERYISRAVVLSGSKRIRVKFLLGGSVRMDGPGRISENTFDVPASAGDRSLSLKFCANSDVCVGSRIDVAIILVQVKWRKVRVALAGILLLAALAPPAVQLFGLSFLSFTFNLGKAVGITVPAAFLIAVVASWHRVIPVITRLLTTELNKEVAHEPHEDDRAHIDIVATVSSTDPAQWSAK